MSDESERADGSAGGVRTRAMELAVAAGFFALGALVVFDSHRLGSSWGADGPEAGYFPFYVGLIICVSSLVILGQTLARRGARSAVFVEWQALRQVLSVLVPAAVFVLAIQLIGLY